VTLLLYGQLPPRLRRELGITYRSINAIAYRAASNGSRLLCAITPGPIRRLPGELAMRGTLSAPPPRPRRHLRA
jgi:hypothetical protein